MENIFFLRNAFLCLLRFSLCLFCACVPGAGSVSLLRDLAAIFKIILAWTTGNFLAIRIQEIKLLQWL